MVMMMMMMTMMTILIMLAPLTASGRRCSVSWRR
jgi:hypothetical protein